MSDDQTWTEQLEALTEREPSTARFLDFLRPACAKMDAAEARIEYAAGVDPRQRDPFSPFGVGGRDGWQDEMSRYVGRIAALERRGYVLESETMSGPVPESGDWSVSIIGTWRRPDPL